jgi:hypothetical protein
MSTVSRASGARATVNAWSANVASANAVRGKNASVENASAKNANIANMEKGSDNSVRAKVGILPLAFNQILNLSSIRKPGHLALAFLNKRGWGRLLF